MKNSILLNGLLLGACLPLLSGCIVERQPRRVVVVQQPPPPGQIVVEEQPNPPPPQTEVVPVSPGPEYIWVAGAWDWRGHWVWAPGRWVIGPRPHAVWVPGHWEHRPHGHVWVSGHWR